MQTTLGWRPQCYIPNFAEIGLPVLEKKIFECFFFHIWAWRPSDPDFAIKLLFPLPMEAPHKIWLSSAMQFHLTRVWRPSWSCDPDFAIKLSFPLPIDAPHKILLSSAKQFQRRRCLKFSHVTYVSKIDPDIK